MRIAILLALLSSISAPSLHAAGPPIVEVHGPTIVAFFPPVTKAELESDPDTNESLSDFQFYAGIARETLSKAGIDFHEVYARSGRIKVGDKTMMVHPPKSEAGYYLAAPGKPPRIAYGVMTDADLRQLAEQYFQISVPSDSKSWTSSQSKRGKGQSYRSPDGRLTAVVAPSGVQGDESRVSIIDNRGKRICAHDFSSPDGDHGHGVDGAGWTADSRFFVFRMRSSGGHSPMYAPVVFWSRKADRFYQANDFTADQTFEITGQEDVRVSTWPALNPITITLGKLTSKQLSELR